MFRKLTLFTLSLLLIPLGAWALRWQWQAGDYYIHPKLDYPLYWLTETGSMPYALLTNALFMLLAVRLSQRHYGWRLVCLVCLLSLLSTQLIKSGVKELFAEPRPFVSTITEQAISTDDFYALSRPDRGEFVASYYTATEHPRLADHQVQEVGYSFPSGHTIFAVSWLLLFAGFLHNRQSLSARALQGGLFIWAALMLISRLRLGMHYPIDLLASTLISWALHIMLFLGVIPKLETFDSFKRG